MNVTVIYVKRDRTVQTNSIYNLQWHLLIDQLFLFPCFLNVKFVTKRTSFQQLVKGLEMCRRGLDRKEILCKTL